MSNNFLPIFSSKSFIVSGLTCRSLIYFQFIFVYSVRECSNLILLHVAVQFSKHHLFISSTVYPCLLCHRVGDSSCVDLSLGFYPILFVYISIFVPVLYCPDYCNFVVQSEVREIDFSNCFSFSRLHQLFVVFCVSIQIVIFLF